MGLGQTQSVQQMIISAAQQYGVPTNIALGIAAHESGFNPSAINNNTNGTSDYGVMQLNTSTLQTLGLTPIDALDPQTNIDAAMALLGGYIDQYGDINTALQAYASGPGNVASGASPNQTAQGFISYVTSYVPTGITTASPILPTSPDDLSLDSDLSDLSELSDSSSGTIDPTMLGIGIMAALALWALSQNA